MARNENNSCTLSEMDKMGILHARQMKFGHDENTSCKLEWNAENAMYFM